MIMTKSHRPTKDEIDKQCQRIQANWSDKERFFRAFGIPQVDQECYTVPEISLRDLECDDPALDEFGVIDEGDPPE